MTHLASLYDLICTCSLRGAVLISIVLVLRCLLRGRVPSQCFHWLWVLVAIRLLLPTAPGSATSIFNLLGAARPTSNADGPKWIIRKDAGAPIAGVKSTLVSSAETKSAPADIAASHAIIRLNPLPVIWLAGVALQVLLLTRSAWTMRQSLRRARQVTDPDVLRLASECAKAVGIRSRIQLVESPAFGGPSIIGFWRPRLVLPPGLSQHLTAEELRFVLLHECAHVRRRDLAMIWLFTAARVIHWFNPLAWVASRVARIDTELACDETLLRHASPSARVPYGETLLKLSQLTAWRQPAIPAVAIAEGRRAIRLRLEHIAAFNICSRWRTAAAIGLVLGVSLVFAADETSNVRGAADETKAPLAQQLPQWAKEWSIARVNLPKDRDASKAEIEFLISDREKRTLKVGEASEADAWVEKLESDSVGGESRWKATLRKGDERAEFLAVVAAPDIVQVEIDAKFVATSETTIRRLRLKAPEDGGAGLAILDDRLRGRETTHILTPPQASELFTTLSGAKGTDLLSAPRVTTKSGQKATIEIIREVRYPAQWDATWNEKLKKRIWKPVSFETRNTGVMLEALATVQAEGTIALSLTPQVVELLGFRDIDNGKAIPTTAKQVKTVRQTKAVDSVMTSRMTELLKPILGWGSSEHPVWRSLPVFSTRKVTVAPTLQSGETYVCTDLPETETVTPFKSRAATKRLIALITARILSLEPEQRPVAGFPAATDHPRARLPAWHKDKMPLHGQNFHRSVANRTFQRQRRSNNFRHWMKFY
ncbi:MAG TPA: M56 family metallopeptidase [Chthoniobacteraceae bacterium]|nr:M56 family metallopeptidase [Chthoniobacteraceae bacterium]